MADVIYNSAKKKILDADIDFAADTLKVMLVTSTYTPDQDTHDFRDDVTNEVSGTGYTAGGATLANKAVTVDNTDNEGVFDADDVSWTTSTITARGAVLYKSLGGASSADPIVCYFDFGSDKSSSAGTFTIQWGSEGILNLN